MTTSSEDSPVSPSTDRDRWIWPFELLEKVGEGGMGVVYRARYVVDNRHVAVKLLPADVSDPQILARFERELDILKTLRHPHIVRCFGGVCENKRRFYAMELVEGGTLDELLLQRGRLPWEQVVEFGKQMCDGLAYAHQRGVIHRDVKPGNFLITATGQLKLSDFGLASLAAGRKITAAGKTMGTYGYMAPEQIRGKTPSAQTDLYALGCVFFELLTGRPPFLGDTPAEILQKHLKEPPPQAATLALDCPPLLDKLITQLLCKSPEDRPAGAVAVARDLSAVTMTVTVETTRKPASGISNRPTTLPDRRSGSAPAASTPSSPAPSTSMAVPLPKWLPATAIAILAVLLLALVTLHHERGELARSHELWIQHYQTGELQVRKAAAHALGELGRDADVLAKGLSDPNPEIRRASAEALGQIGADAKGFIPTLITIQRDDEDALCRTTAGNALKKIQDAEPRRSWGYRLLVGLILLAAGTSLITVWRRAK